MQDQILDSLKNAGIEGIDDIVDEKSFDKECASCRRLTAEVIAGCVRHYLTTRRSFMGLTPM